jgi:hypothetical protein
MKKVLLAASLSLASIAAQAQGAKFEWVKGMGGTGNESGNAMTLDSAGNVYTTGNFSGTVTFDASNTITSKGNNDVFVTKHNTSGTIVWAIQIGGLSDDLVRGIAVDKSYVYITGNYNQTCDFDPSSTATYNYTSRGIGDIFVAKYELSTGNIVWAKSMGGVSSDLGFGIAVDKDGYVYTTGNYAGSCDFNPGATVTNLTSLGLSDIFISKLDKDGNFEWAKSIGSIGSDGGVSITLDQDANPIIGGAFSWTVDFDPSAGTSNLTSLGSNDIFVTKFNSMGLMQWVKQIGGTGNEYLEFLTTDKWGNALYTCRYENGADFDPGAATFNLSGTGRVAVSKLRNNGDFVWAKKLGSTATAERPKCVAVDTFGSVYTVGEFDGTSDFDPGVGTANLVSAGGTDIFVSKLDSNGAYNWAVSFSEPSSLTGNGVIVANDGSVYTTGAFAGTCDFEPSSATLSLISAGANDIFVHKLNQCNINKTTTLTGNTISANMIGATYQWVNCPSYTAISGATSQNYTPTTSGSYAVIISNGATCKDTSACVAVTGTNINENSITNQTKIYPNPAQDFVTLDKLPISGKISLINILGNVVMEIPINDSKMTLDTKNYSKGIYFLQISSDASETPFFLLKRAVFLFSEIESFAISLTKIV